MGITTAYMSVESGCEGVQGFRNARYCVQAIDGESEGAWMH